MVVYIQHGSTDSSGGISGSTVDILNSIQESFQLLHFSLELSLLDTFLLQLLKRLFIHESGDISLLLFESCM